MVFVAVWSTIDCFWSERNTYLYDIKDDIVSFDRNKDVFFFLYKNEFNRLRSKEQENFSELPMSLFSKEAYDYIYTTYEFWNNDALIINMEKESTNKGNEDCFFASCKPIRRYYTKKNKSKSLALYHIEKTTPKIYLHHFSDDNKALISDILKNGILKSYSILKDTYIFQLNNSLYWIIGSDISPKTEIIFHIYTNKPELLPEARRKFRFDNQGFRTSSKFFIGKADDYIILKRNIPSAYPIAYINVGFNNKDDGLTWFKSFTINPFD